MKWKHFPRNWPFVRGIHRSPLNSPHKGQWRGDLMFILICARINGWVNNGEAGDLRRYRAHYDVIVMFTGAVVLWNVYFFNAVVFNINISLYTTYIFRMVYAAISCVEKKHVEIMRYLAINISVITIHLLAKCTLSGIYNWSLYLLSTPVY